MNKILFTLVSVVIFSCSSRSQKSEFKPLFTAITVANIDSSISWYSEVLNLKLRNRVDNETRGFKQANLIGDGILIELVELDKAASLDELLKGQPSGTQALGFYKFGLAVRDIDALFQRFSSMSVNFLGRMVKDPADNKKTFIITDPDGNLIQFIEE